MMHSRRDKTGAEKFAVLAQQPTTERRWWKVVVTTLDGQQALAWAGQAPGRDAQRYADKLAADTVGRLVRDTRRLDGIGLDPDMRVVEIALHPSDPDRP